MSNQLIKPLNRKLLKGILFSPNEVEERHRQSPYFHSPDKGCEIEERVYYRGKTRKKLSKLKGYFCKTHQKEICRCGWEFKFHYGTYSGEIEKVGTKTNNLSLCSS